MDVNTAVIQDGDATLSSAAEAPSPVPKQKSLEGNVKRKRRRGKSKRKIVKPFSKVPWQDRRRNDKTKRFRSMVLSKTHAPFNNNQFLMEIHKPEPENNFQSLQTPARTRDSSFSVDSEENYFYSLPEDEEDFLTKEFSSVYEDAQSERLSNMSKNELIQEYLLLEAKYDNLVKKPERGVRSKTMDDDKESSGSEKETSVTDSMCTEKDTSGTSAEVSTVEEPSVQDVLARLKEQEEQINELKIANEKLKLENECLRNKSQNSSTEDSESDSSSTSISCSSSSRASPVEMNVDSNGINGHTIETNGNGLDEIIVNGHHDHELSPQEINGDD